MINLVFVTKGMEIGGIEKALLNMIHLLDRKKYKIHVVLIKTTHGKMMSLFPPDVSIHCIAPEGLRQSWKRGGFFSLLYCFLYRMLIRLTKRHFSLNISLITRLCRFPDDVPCDVLVVYSHVHYPFLWGIQQKQKNKVLFIHQSWFSENYEAILKAHIHKFGKIVCVSDAAKHYVDTRFPRCASRTEVIHNFLVPYMIRKLSDDPVDPPLKHFCLLTVTRLHYEKGCQYIPAILHNILERGIEANWYIVGDGRLFQDLEKMIKELGLQDHLFLLGGKVNPYPYMKACDVYVQPSLQEGYGISLQEAKILCKPIVATDIPAFRELIDSGVNGTLAVLNRSSSIIENDLDIDIQGFADAIIALIQDQEKRDGYSKWLRSHPEDVDGTELEKLDKMFSEVCGKTTV